ncbi:MAG: hypothetical protein ACM3ZA_08800 [Bacillota bacterium]
MLGFLFGGILFGLSYNSVYMPIYKLANIGPVTMASLWNVSPWLIILLFTQVSLLLFYFFEKHNV